MLCPKENGKFDPKRNQPCRDCPRKIRKVEFERATERLWDKHIDEEYRIGISFHDVYRQIEHAIIAKDLAESKRPVTMNSFVTFFESEQARFEEVQRLANGK